MRDLAHNIAAVQVVVPAVLSATDTSAAIDLKGYDGAVLIINTGAIASSGNFTPKLQESDTTATEDFDDVAAGDLIGTFPSALAATSVYKVGYIGNKRYVRTVLTKNSGTSITAGAVIIKGYAQERPVS